MYNTFIFENDKLSRKISLEDRKIITKLAEDCAVKKAKIYSMESIYELLRKEGIQINEVTNNKNETFFFRAQINITDNKKEILIYKDTILEAVKIYGYDYDFFKNLYLAHEFFHFLEYKNDVNLTYKVCRLKIFGYKLYANVESVSEIAANHFASLICNTNFNPIKLDLEKQRRKNV